MLEFIIAAGIVTVITAWTIVWLVMCIMHRPPFGMFAPLALIPLAVAELLSGGMLVLSQIFGWNPIYCVVGGSLPALIPLWFWLQSMISDAEMERKFKEKR